MCHQCGATGKKIYEQPVSGRNTFCSDKCAKEYEDQFGTPEHFDYFFYNLFKDYLNGYKLVHPERKLGKKWIWADPKKYKKGWKYI